LGDFFQKHLVTLQLDSITNISRGWKGIYLNNIKIGGNPRNVVGSKRRHYSILFTKIAVLSGPFMGACVTCVNHYYILHYTAIKIASNKKVG
jgi:hypothetical protein